MLIYLEPDSNTPAALFVDATSVTRENEEILLDGSVQVRAGVLIDRNGERRRASRPQQMHTRWYGFALTFPGCDVFEG